MGALFGVVIIEDNKATADMVHHIIDWQSYGFKVKAVLYDGVRGLEAIKRHRPELIIADINMPSMDGLAMAEACRELLPHSLIIFITAYSDFMYAHRAIKLRAFDYLLKPFSQTELKLLIHRATEEIQKEAHMHARQIVAREFAPAIEEEAPLIIKDICRYIEENISQKLSLEALAEQFQMSASHMGKLIRQHTGKRYSEYLTELRMAYAKALLMNPRYRVEEVSAMVGYRNYVTFYKVFMRCEGISPTVFRNCGPSSPSLPESDPS